MKRSAEVIIVGAGVTGCSIAWHLATMGVHDVLLVEKLAAAGQGSTSKANGGIRAQFSTAVNIRMSLYSIAAFERFEEETGGDCGLRQAGYLFMTGTAAGEDYLRRNFELQQSLGVPNIWLDRHGIEGLAPYVYAEDLQAGTYSSKDGFIDPNGATLGYLQAARRLGVTLLADTEVVQVTRVGAGVTGVRTDSGTLHSRIVVDAAGPFAGVVAHSAGVSLPVEPYKRMIACTEQIGVAPAVIPMTIDLDTGVLIRREGPAIILAYSDPDDTPGFDTTFDPAFIEAVAERALPRFPFLSDAEISLKRCWAGLYPETPDHHAILGEHPDLRGFFVAAGFGGHGLMHSPATGRALAELIARGECSFMDISPLRPERFGQGDLLVETSVL